MAAESKTPKELWTLQIHKQLRSVENNQNEAHMCKASPPELLLVWVPSPVGSSSSWTEECQWKPQRSSHVGSQETCLPVYVSLCLCGTCDSLLVNLVLGVLGGGLLTVLLTALKQKSKSLG